MQLKAQIEYKPIFWLKSKFNENSELYPKSQQFSRAERENLQNFNIGWCNRFYEQSAQKSIKCSRGGG